MSQTVLFVLRRDFVLEISYSPIHETLLYVNHENIFATCPVVSINECRDENMPTMGISQNSDEFVSMVKQFTPWQTAVDKYITTL